VISWQYMSQLRTSKVWHNTSLTLLSLYVACVAGRSGSSSSDAGKWVMSHGWRVKHSRRWRVKLVATGVNRWDRSWCHIIAWCGQFIKVRHSLQISAAYISVSLWYRNTRFSCLRKLCTVETIVFSFWAQHVQLPILLWHSQSLVIWCVVFFHC